MGKVVGPCHLCGKVGELTFEHVPPRAAFNRWPVVLATYEEWERGYGSEYLPEGRGGHVLCRRCNSDTGGAYGAAFADWCKQGFERLHQVAGERSAIYHGDVQPLRVIKQIATMFFATCGPKFRTAHPYLVKFVLDPEQRGLPARYRFHAFWYGGGSLRQTGVTAAMNTEADTLNVLAELVHPPFGYVLSLEGPLHDRRPTDITDFAAFAADETIRFRRRLPVLETHWMMPGDYRTREQIATDAARNHLAAAGVRDPDEALRRLWRDG